MTITASDVDNQSFSVDRKGYSIEEVDIFLERVSKDVDVLHQTIKDLEAKISSSVEEATSKLNSEKADLQATIANKEAEIERLNSELEKKAVDGKVISEALIVAQRSAEKIIQEANDKAAKIVKDANEKADYIEKDADDQKKRVMDEIDKLDKERKATNKQYQSMLREIIGEMNKHLTDLHESPRVDSAPDKTANNIHVKHANITPKPVAADVKPEPQKDFSGFGDADFGEEAAID